MNKDTLKERVKTFMTNFDIGQRLFLNGKLHSTNWNKKTEEELLEIIEQTRKEERDRIVEMIKSEIGDIRFDIQAGKNSSEQYFTAQISVLEDIINNIKG